MTLTRPYRRTDSLFHSRHPKDLAMQTVARSPLVRRLSAAAAALACAGAAAFAPLAHADTLDTIAKSGVVRVGVFEDYPPFG